MKTNRERQFENQSLGLSGSVTIASGQLVTGKFRRIVCLAATAFTTLTDALEKTTVEYGPKSTGTLTYTGLPTAAQTITIHGIVYTFRAAPTLATEILIGADATAMAVATVAAVNINDPLVRLTNLAGVVTIVARDGGVAGNAFTLATTGTNTSVSGATLASGADLTAAKTPTYPALSVIDGDFSAIQPSAGTVRAYIAC